MQKFPHITLYLMQMIQDFEPYMDFLTKFTCVLNIIHMTYDQAGVVSPILFSSSLWY